MNALVPIQTTNAEVYRASTDAAELCKGIVVASAMEIQKRKYVKVEGWMAIAVAHGCTGSARDVERIEGGVRAIGEIRRMSDGALIAQAEGFVGEDEPTWFGGEVEKDEWINSRRTGKKITTVLPKRADYAIRAMAQTRAISRACRSAFAHVVVMMNAGLSTTPAEEVPDGGFNDDAPAQPRNFTPAPTQQRAAPPKASPGVTWQTLDDEMDACRSVAELEAWNKRRESDAANLPTARFDALAAKYVDLINKLPATSPAKPNAADFGLGADDIPEFA